MEEVKNKPFRALKASFIVLFASLMLCLCAAFIEEPEKAYAADSDWYTAEIQINGYGTIVVELDRAAAPTTVDNFVKLARSGFYNGLTFHRVVKGFMIQGGDPKGNGTGGSGTNIKGEFSSNGWQNPISHKRGVISMARASNLNSASSQFFIVHQDATFLDGQYAAFGHVVSGMNVVDSIANTRVNGETPLTKPVIKSIKIAAGHPSSGWVKNKTGWWYQYDSITKVSTKKSYPANEWVTIAGKRYHFNSSGYMNTGWYQSGKTWYYLGSDGAMKTGWQKVKGTWYYLNSNGVMQTTKQKIGGATYNFKSSGAMITGWNKEGSTWYYYNGSGAMTTGWQKVKGKWYYLGNDGKMKTGQYSVGSDQYYSDSSGAMQTGWVKTGNKWYYYNGSGAMVKNRWISGKYWVGSDGVMATNTRVDGGKYYVDGNGVWVPGK